MKNLWGSDSLKDWEEVLNSYEKIIDKQSSERLPGHDRWYREELPKIIAARAPLHITLEELARITEWKMTRGTWRARNLALVKSNSSEKVIETSTEALSLAPHPTKPIAKLAELAGVGPATASAVASAAMPGVYPFFDEAMASQVPELGEVVYTLGYYGRYAAALRDRAEQLEHGWTPAMVERALWANAGGKAGRT